MSKLTAPEFVETLVTLGVRELTAAGIDEPQARGAIEAVARALCDAYAKQLVYIPAGMALQINSRNTEMWDAYGLDGPDGTKKYTAARVAQLAGEHGMSVQAVYRILNAARQREVAERQGILPGFDPAEPPSA